MINIAEKKDCCGCASCYNVCPNNCISMIPDEEGFKYPVIDATNCIECGMCDKSCPMKNNINLNTKVLAIGAYNKDASIRKESTSGGVFRSLCEYVIGRGGVVFGATFNDKYEVVHTFFDNMEECKNFSGSKYVQSDINNCYSQVKNFLNIDRYVLFSGTPCQIFGLKTFLKKDYDRLITVDIVCHSVPSPLIWKEYIKIISKDREISDLNFRSKLFDSDSDVFYVQLDNGEQIIEPYGDNLYIKGFTSGLISRPSCYDCKFSNISRESDFTLGDLWGVDIIYPELVNEYGTSLVLINTKKAKQIYKCIKNKFIRKKVNIDKAIIFNPAIKNSIEYNEYRKYIFDDKNLLRNLEKYIDITPKKVQNSYSLSIFEKIKIKVFNKLR